jgi:type I restriction enzyme M protein
MNDVFYGADANEGVAAAAKMNMIVAGDGHTNIRQEDSLRVGASCWSLDQGTYDFILTNPPFGTSEAASLPVSELERYPIKTTKGQLLFLQRMLLATKPGGLVCTVIDEGVLNTDSATAVREWVLQNSEVLAVVRLPDDTFKPNKINVRSSVLLLKRRGDEDTDLESDYLIAFCNLTSLGYQGSGEPIRGFDFSRLRLEMDTQALSRLGTDRAGYAWSALDVRALDIVFDPSHRLDLKYWNPYVRAGIEDLALRNAPRINDLNTIETLRGKSPPADLYVDESDGYAVVVKAGSSISRYGELVLENSDYVEKLVFDEMPSSAKCVQGDVLLASTGDGTLGKACVYDKSAPAVVDGHVTIIRVDSAVLDPYYLADYLRCGFGQDQIQRVYSGSTGLVELTPDHVNAVRVELPPSIEEQQEVSKTLREQEQRYLQAMSDAGAELQLARSTFRL